MHQSLSEIMEEIIMLRESKKLLRESNGKIDMSYKEWCDRHRVIEETYDPALDDDNYIHTFED